jgi:micrococcal nuclease
VPRRHHVRRPPPAAALVVLVALVISVATGGCGGRTAAATHATDGAPGAATVTRVVDGDTIIVSLAGRDEKVRLIGIDTPETKKPDTPVECFGKEASARMGQFLPRGTPVRLVRDAEARDRYGRLLAYVYRTRDGLFVNLAMAKEGFAAPLTIPPNVAHTDEFVAAAAAARRAGRGLWGRCASGHSAAPATP